MSEHDRKQKRGGRVAQTARTARVARVVQAVRVTQAVQAVQAIQLVQVVWAPRVIRVEAAALIEAVADGRRYARAAVCSGYRLTLFIPPSA